MGIDDLKCYKIMVRSLDIKTNEVVVEKIHIHASTLKEGETMRDDLIEKRMMKDKFNGVSKAYSYTIEQVLNWNTKDSIHIERGKRASGNGNCQSIW